jgi:hypothetical protein
VAKSASRSTAVRLAPRAAAAAGGSCANGESCAYRRPSNRPPVKADSSADRRASSEIGATKANLGKRVGSHARADDRDPAAASGYRRHTRALRAFAYPARKPFRRQGARSRLPRLGRAAPHVCAKLDAIPPNATQGSLPFCWPADPAPI